MSSLSQEQIEAQLAAYIDGELDDVERAEIEKHLAGNERHRRMIAQMLRHKELIATLPSVPAPASILESLDPRLERGALLDPPATGHPSFWQRSRPILAAAAAVVLISGIGVGITFLSPGDNDSRELAAGGPSTAPARDATTENELGATTVAPTAPQTPEQPPAQPPAQTQDQTADMPAGEDDWTGTFTEAGPLAKLLPRDDAPAGANVFEEQTPTPIPEVTTADVMRDDAPDPVAEAPIETQPLLPAPAAGVPEDAVVLVVTTDDLADASGRVAAFLATRQIEFANRVGGLSGVPEDVSRRVHSVIPTDGDAVPREDEPAMRQAPSLTFVVPSVGGQALSELAGDLANLPSAESAALMPSQSVAVAERRQAEEMPAADEPVRPIRPGEELQIVLTYPDGQQETATATVGDTGHADFGKIGRIDTLGKTPEELAPAIREAARMRLNEPDVDVVASRQTTDAPSPADAVQEGQRQQPANIPAQGILASRQAQQMSDEPIRPGDVISLVLADGSTMLCPTDAQGRARIPGFGPVIAAGRTPAQMLESLQQLRGDMLPTVPEGEIDPAASGMAAPGGPALPQVVGVLVDPDLSLGVAPGGRTSAVIVLQSMPSPTTEPASTIEDAVETDDAALPTTQPADASSAAPEDGAASSVDSAATAPAAQTPTDVPNAAEASNGTIGTVPPAAAPPEAQNLRDVPEEDEAALEPFPFDPPART